jgi:hypothetical protein
MKHSNLFSLLSSMALVAGLLVLAPGAARADSYQRLSTDGHPLRIMAYIVHPIGIALDYGITRPMHALASQADLDILMGHKAAPGDVFFEWNHGDGTPGIAEKMEKQQATAMESETSESPQ